MNEGLRNRRTTFLLGLGFCALALAVSLLTAPHPDEASQPTTLTAIFLIYALGSIALWYAVLLQPERVVEMAERQDPRPSLGRMSWLLSVMGVAGMVMPVVLGVILYQISGETWRLALLAGIGLIGGAILYWRVGEDLRRLADHGLTPWDPFGPSMG